MVFHANARGWRAEPLECVIQILAAMKEQMYSLKCKVIKDRLIFPGLRGFIGIIKCYEFQMYSVMMLSAPERPQTHTYRLLFTFSNCSLWLLILIQNYWHPGQTPVSVPHCVSSFQWVDSWMTRCHFLNILTSHCSSLDVNVSWNPPLPRN